jgi:hypothetical protein
MSTIVVKPKSNQEETFLKELFKKMNVDTHLVEDFEPNYETKKAISDVESKIGTKVKSSDELFKQLGI